MTELIADDEDWRALNYLSNKGHDLSKITTVEFFINSPNEVSSKEIQRVLESKGLDSDIYFDEGEFEEVDDSNQGSTEFTSSWTVYVYYTIIPIHQKILDIQKELDELSNPFGGKSDGWQVNIGDYKA